MGQTQPTTPFQLPSFQQLEEYADSIFNPIDNNKLTSEMITISTLNIINCLRTTLPAEMVHDRMQLNLVMLKIFYHPNFTHTMLKLLQILNQKLQQFNSRNLLLIKRQEFTFFLSVANFILFFTDEKLSQTMESLTFRNDLTSEARSYINKLQSKQHKFISHKNFFDKLNSNEAKQIHQGLENTLIKFIASRTQILTRSSQTFQVISQIEQSFFMLFVKLINTPHHKKTFLAQIRNVDSLRNHLKISQYFLGQGCDQCRASVYEPSVLLLFQLIDKNAKSLNEIDSQMTSLPSHFYNKIPIILKNTFYHFLAVVCLFGLAFFKEGSQFYVRLSFNRIPTLILLNSLISEMKVTSPQMTQFLQKISLQTKIGSIERSFMTDLVEKYNKLVKEKIKQNKRIEEVKKTTSGFTNKFLQKVRFARPNEKPSQQITSYSLESLSSQILEKYLKSGTQPYIIKFGQRKYVISPNLLTQQFDKNEEFQQKELKAICERFTYENILKRKVTYRYIDSVEWNIILPRIIKSQNLFGEELRQDQVESMNGVRKQKKIVGSMPVIRQKYIGNILSQNQSPLKKDNNKGRSQYLQTQAQGIYQKTTEDQNVEEFRLENKVTNLIRETTNDKAESSKKNEISLDFEEQEHGQIQQIDERLQTSEFELNKNANKIEVQHKFTNRSENSDIDEGKDHPKDK